MNGCRSLSTRNKGIAAVEYVFVLPLVMLLIIATAEIGRGFIQYNALNKALRDGARLGAQVTAQNAGSTGIPQLANSDVTNIRNLVVFSSIQGGGASVLPGLTPGNIIVELVDSDLNVSANYNYQPLFSSIPTFGLGSTISSAFNFRARVAIRSLIP